MGFRSYIRHFLRAILMPFRPSLPWCFPIRELPFEQREQQEQEQQQQKEEKVAQIILFDDQPYGFRFRHDQPSFKKNMVVSVNEGTPLKKKHFRLGFSMKRPFSYWCYLYWGSSIYGNPKGWLPPWLWKISPFYIRSIGAKKPNDDYTHTKKKKWGACVSKWKMIPPKQQFDRFWYCKYWNQIGTDGLSSY